MKKILALSIVVLLALSVLASCGSSDSGLVGYWKGNVEGSEAIIEFSDDGTGKVYYVSDEGSFYFGIEWKDKGDKLEVTMMDETDESEYKLEGDKLTLDGEVLERVSKSDVPDDAVDISSLASLG
ncbi:MAG: hypothetical protein PUB34_00785 [Clostridia bacterium]|nr:hypothetical protein [Clostridia bacterium]